MKAMILNKPASIDQNSKPLQLSIIQEPTIGKGDVLLKVKTCGVCHTELDEIEGRTPPLKIPIVPGHQVVGVVEDIGEEVIDIVPGQRMGVGWIHSSCGKCEFCMAGKENLCPDFLATGRDADGGYAEYMVIPSSSAYPIPQQLSDEEAAPLLCAGAIGYRSLLLSGINNGNTLGLLGFGASSHLVLKLVRNIFPDSQVFVFTRNVNEQQFSLELGAKWAGPIDANPPELIQSIIDTTPAWKPIVKSLEYLKPGGRLVINAIRKESNDKDWLLKLDYAKHLWMEKEVKSVANVTRNDIKDFLVLAAKYSIKPEYQIYELKDANQALIELKERKVHGAKVLKIS
jgi:alcohol dehydrogenase, propanol-preferring